MTLIATVISLVGYSKPASATTFNVTVGPGFNLVFDPASVTIHRGDSSQQRGGTRMGSDRTFTTQ